jgi:SOS-response transcriptional repressor LexA
LPTSAEAKIFHQDRQHRPGKKIVHSAEGIHKLTRKLTMKALKAVAKDNAQQKNIAQFYYLQVIDDSMETIGNPSFPLNSYICIDTTRYPKHNDFVIAQASSAGEIVFRQLIINGKQRILHPLNIKYSDIQMADDGFVQGVICHVIKLF